MPSFGQSSKDKLATCHQKLQDVMNEVITLTDIKVLCGTRGQKEQDEAFANGTSTKRYPNSKHNTSPSLAVDVVPYPIDWSDIQRFKDLAVIIKSVAAKLGVDIRWGGDWHTFKDYPHWELPNG